MSISQGMPHLSFRVLGPVEAVSDTAGPVDLGGLKQRAVLALLIVNAGRVVSLDRFVTELWDEYPPARATSSLQAYVSRLRRLLEPGREPRKPSRLLPTLPPGWLLAVPPEAVDAAAFTRLAAEGRRLLQDRQPVAAHQALDDALTLWRGPALAEFLPAPFARAEGTRLEELRLTAAEDRLEAELDLGQAAAVVAETEALLTEHPYRERLWAQLMLALYRCGRQADALASYQRARHRLDADLGIDPGAELQRLQELILGHSAELEPRPLPPAPGRAPAVPVRRRAPVPAAGTPLAGRDDVLARLDDVLSAVRSGQGRLVLLRGSAGIGKTALLREVALRSAAAGVAVASGSCPEADTPPVFWPWLQVFRDLIETAGPDAVTAAFAPHGNVIGLLDSSLAGLLPLPLLEPAADPELGRTRLFHGLASGLAALAADRPFVLLLDDMHWADAASLQLFTLLARHLVMAPVALVAAYRDEDAPAKPAFSRALGRLATVPGVEEITLGGLDRDAAAACVQAIAGRTVAPEVATVLHARTGGNPFFLGELVRMLSAERTLDDVAMAAERLPERLQEGGCAARWPGCRSRPEPCSRWPPSRAGSSSSTCWKPPSSSSSRCCWTSSRPPSWRACCWRTPANGGLLRSAVLALELVRADDLRGPERAAQGTAARADGGGAAGRRGHRPAGRRPARTRGGAGHRAARGASDRIDAAESARGRSCLRAGRAAPGLRGRAGGGAPARR